MIARNIRGLGKKSVNKELRLLCRNVNPDIIFLSETKMNKDMASRKLKNMGFPCTFNVSSVGRSGGLVLAWKKEIYLNIISSSMRGIFVTSTDIIHSKTCHIHFVYGEPNSSLRQYFWEKQYQYSNAPLDEPVFFICDFNALLGTNDKNGGLEVDDSDFSNLRNFCSVFNLHDTDFSDPIFTWSNMQQCPDLILERLDTFLINQSAEDLFPKLCVNNLPRDSSDHCPMHIGFNYENVSYKLKAKLLSTKKGLIDWNKSSFSNIQTNIYTIRKDLADIQISNPTDTNTTSRLKARLEYLYNLEELYWKEKSREQFQDKILSDLPIKLSTEDNSFLNMPLTLEQIKNDVFQMGGKKAPGLMALQYRLIELCNFIYKKILSKTLTNRLKPFMNNIISQNQSAFIPKRSISDNILLANEAIYAVNHNDKIEGITVIKLDMSKAYDKLE
ncbi:uncharacterized protein LOC113279706 [Papaver somniferum]|uniref:uncharacterized protein LOC113279706 n=1 Tax=Papaver somniferum TaxID=3469 RepID=UPI000E6F7A3E|nr:uncharacterized protein LOC113279706 [Papaver somniferum]